MKTRHTLLTRQLRRQFGDISAVPAEWASFLDLIDQSYRNFDTDRVMLERTLELSSEELLQANAEMRAVFESFPDVFLWLDPEGVVLNVRANPLSDVHLPPEVVHGPWCSDAGDPVIARLGEALEQARLNGTSVTIEFTLQVSGFPRHLEARLLPLVDHKALAVVRNITHRKEVAHAKEEQLRSAATRVDSLGVLAGGIAHDFNNLLSALLAHVSLADGIVTDPRAKELLSEAAAAVHRGAGLTRQLLTFAKGGSLVRQTASAADLLREAVSFSLRGSRTRAEFDIASELPDVSMDPTQISQVIQNLLINADQAMPKGGVVKITARDVIIGAADGFPVPAGRYVRMSFADTGVGIAEEILHRIFDPYFTTKAGGSGLGLATSFSIISKHGGLLSAESRVGSGATFHVLLPAAEVPSVRNPNPKAESTSKARRVLVMDDEAAVLRGTRQILEHLGCTVVTASDGVEGVARCNEAHEKGEPFEVLIADLTVPGGMGGREMVEQLKARYPAVIAIASSGYSADWTRSGSKLTPFDAVLPKPYGLSELRNIMATVSR